MSEDPHKRGGPGSGRGPVTGLRLAECAAARGLREAVLARLEPGELRSLAAAPPGWTLGGRAAAGVEFGAGRLLLVAGGLPDQIRDWSAGAPRPSTPADTAAFCALADALPEVAAVAPPPAAGDEPAAVRRLAAVAAAFAASGKHILAIAAEAAEVRSLAAMARAVATSVRESPAASGDAEPASAPAGALMTAGVMPGDGCREAALAAAAEDLPCLVAVAPSFLAATDPVAAAAEPLAAAIRVAAAVQTAAPGAAVGLVVPPMPPVPRAQLGAGGLAALVAVAQTGRALGLPVAATAMAAHSTAPDWLSSTENTAAALAAGMAGLDAILGAGLLDGGASVSLEELATDAEIYSYCAATVAGFPVDDDTLALETVKAVGIGGNYLGQRHTRKNMRGVWRTRLFDRTPYEQWLRDGRRQAPELAAELVRATLADHEPPPLDAAVAATLDRIVLGKES